ncbi:hemolysin family protein [Arthrobacter sp. M4]|uniref:hemolysin family protein n=1 Tax=Arthrobacter sp. M4 TaxID=218160 RepID=UPI001CDC3410|nr:hemolysin family protein [Arthrobacter sp. M4]MCA4131399.1 hemolysin family protein [Arthrobacter sp. M4]
MTQLILVIMAMVFLGFVAVLTAAEAAFSFLPRHEAAQALVQSRGTALRRILEQPVSHIRALRFWRVWFEMAAAVAVALLVLSVLDNVWLAGLAATGIMAVVGFVLVGVSPRQIGRQHPGGVVRVTARLIRFLCWILGPVPSWLVSLGSAVAPGAPGGDESFFSEEEFRELVDRASESAVIEDDEAELIQSVFDFGDTMVRSVMVPRTDMVCIESGSSLQQAMALFLRSGYSRIPVIGENADQILGIVYLKDVAAALHGTETDLPRTVDRLSREARYVPESKPVSVLLKELQQESTHVAVVIDEYGGTAGLVTLEDLIEEIVGEIVDEYDSASADAVRLPDGSYRVSSRMSIDDLGELFDLDLDDDEVDTVGGLLAKALGRVPIVGSSVEVAGLLLRADRLEGRRNRVSHIIAAAIPKEETDLNGVLEEAEKTQQQGAPREQAE